MKKWNIVYWNESEGRSKIVGDIWADDQEDATEAFMKLHPEVKRIIGVYEVRTKGCNC